MGSIDLFRPYYAHEAAWGVANVLNPDRDGRVFSGEGLVTERFAREFGDYVRAPYAPQMVSSGTAALDLALHLAGVHWPDPSNWNGEWQEVISTPVTCTASNGVIVNRGAKIVWADVDPRTGLIDPEDVARKITRNTAAIMAVDWGGRSCDYSALHYAARSRAWAPVPIIQDAAHNLLPDMTSAGRNRGDYVCWSFQHIKTLTTGDGGALLTPFDQVQRANLLHWYGLDRNSSADFRCAQSIEEAGYKYQMNDISAAIGLANLPHMPTLIERMRDNAIRYEMLLEDLPGVQIPPADNRSTWWLYTVVVDNPTAFIAFLKEREIQASPVHRRNDVHPAFHFPNGPLPGVDAFADHEVAIPTGWWLKSDDISRVANAVRAYSKSLAEVAA